MTLPLTKQDLKAVFELIDKMPLCIGKGPEPHTVSFLDDNESTGIVVFQDANGAPFMSMPYEDYLALRKLPLDNESASGVL